MTYTRVSLCFLIPRSSHHHRVSRARDARGVDVSRVPRKSRARDASSRTHRHLEDGFLLRLPREHVELLNLYVIVITFYAQSVSELSPRLQSLLPARAPRKSPNERLSIRMHGSYESRARRRRRRVLERIRRLRTTRENVFVSLRVSFTPFLASPSRARPPDRAVAGSGRISRSIERDRAREESRRSRLETYLRLAKETTGGPTENRARRVRVQFRRAPLGRGRLGVRALGANDRRARGPASLRAVIHRSHRVRRHRVSRGEGEHD